MPLTDSLITDRPLITAFPLAVSLSKIDNPDMHRDRRLWFGTKRVAVSHDVVRLGTTTCQDEANGEDRSCKRRRQSEDGSPELRR